MARFPLIESEEVIQVSDKIRIDVAKSFVSGETVITIIEVKPSKADSYVAVTTAKFLDWVYSFTIDIDATNNQIAFNEGGPTLIATLASGNYALSALASEIASKMTAAGGQTYTVTVSGDKFTISAPGAFTLLCSLGSGFTPIFFGSADRSGSSSYTGGAVETVDKEISCRVTTAAGNTVVTKTIQVISESADNLFSEDEDIKLHEPEVMKLLPASRATYKNMHRRAQQLIINWLDKNGYVDLLGDKITKSRFKDKEELREWSAFISLRLIYEGVSNATDDIFHEKALRYGAAETSSRDRAVLRLDLNQDNRVDKFEQTEIRSAVVFRR